MGVLLQAWAGPKSVVGYEEHNPNLSKAGTVRPANFGPHKGHR